jgi:hypothetical protein
MPSASTYRNIPNQDTHRAAFLSFSFLNLLVSLCPTLLFSPHRLLQYSIRRSVRRYISVKRPLCKNMRLYLSDARFTKKKDTNQGYTNPWRQVTPPPSTGNQILTGVAWYLYVVSMELATFQRCGPQIFEVADRFLGNMCTPDTSINNNNCCVTYMMLFLFLCEGSCMTLWLAECNSIPTYGRIQTYPTAVWQFGIPDLGRHGRAVAKDFGSDLSLQF